MNYPTPYPISTKNTTHTSHTYHYYHFTLPYAPHPLLIVLLKFFTRTPPLIIHILNMFILEILLPIQLILLPCSHILHSLLLILLIRTPPQILHIPIILITHILLIITPPTSILLLLPPILSNSIFSPIFHPISHTYNLDNKNHTPFKL